MTRRAPMPAWMQRRRAAEAEPIELTKQEADTVGLFFALDTQWRRCPFTGVRLGLDYAAVRPTAEMLEIEPSARLMTGVRVMEAAAIGALARRAR
jgi:hypothetical protein